MLRPRFAVVGFLVMVGVAEAVAADGPATGSCPPNR